MTVVWAGLARLASDMDGSGSLHIDLTDGASARPTADHHAHLTVASLLAFSVLLLLLLLAARARRTVTTLPARTRWAFSLPAAAWPATPSLTQLRVSRT